MLHPHSNAECRVSLQGVWKCLRPNIELMEPLIPEADTLSPMGLFSLIRTPYS